MLFIFLDEDRELLNDLLFWVFNSVLLLDLDVEPLTFDEALLSLNRVFWEFAKVWPLPVLSCTSFVIFEFVIPLCLLAT